MVTPIDHIIASCAYLESDDVENLIVELRDVLEKRNGSPLDASRSPFTEGQIVYWNDPDFGIASRFVRIVAINHENKVLHLAECEDTSNTIVIDAFFHECKQG